MATDLHEDLVRVWKAIAASASDLPDPEYAFSEAAASIGFSLDPHQERAARHLEGPIRVLAPAGSGKTRTLTARISRLISSGIPADRILALAFNTKAAEEMADRLAELVPGKVQTRTFHSLGYGIVREIGGWRYDPDNEGRVRDLAGSVLRRHLALPAHPGERKRLFAGALAVLVRGKARLTPYREMAVVHGEATHQLAGAFREWVEAQKSRTLLTFADMIYFAVCGLVEDADLRRRWQSRFDFILVDEFQDLNAAQMLLVRILALPQNNLFVVGDDDQLIYAWREAEQRHILDFERMYPGAGTVVLATNYRSGRKIVRHGRWLIENNPERVAKDIRPSETAELGEVEIARAGSPEDQARRAVEWVRRIKHAAGLDWSDFGLLFRINRDAERLEQALTEAGIPFTTARSGPPEPDDSPPDAVEGQVTLMTIHKSKGKEFPYVVVFNLSRGGGASPDEADERRVAYVGVTRAGRGLLVTSGEGRPAPFLIELALNPNFDDYAEPFLERRLVHARRAHLRRTGNWCGWLASHFRSAEHPLPPNDRTGASDEIDLLETELRFRRILGIEKKP